MVDLCKVRIMCSAYKKGSCTGCDCSCAIIGTAEAKMFKGYGYGDQFALERSGDVDGQ